VPDEEHCCAWRERSERREEDKRGEAVEGERGGAIGRRGFQRKRTIGKIGQNG
jgi:hypothetical protein